MQLIKLSRVLMSVLMVATVSGCAHHNLMEAGEEYTSQGRYELAMQAYQKALKLEPDDQETMDRFYQSRDHFDQWLANVRQVADAAYSQSQQGKAMMLYGKIADATQDPAALARYNEIHRQMAANHQLYMQVEADPYLFGNGLGQEINGLTLVSSKKSVTSETSRVHM
ncbi:tetratricopeptide repeat protein [Hahella ganghwensis]|uniref:tetratricopeptide repeat protein n=1 Tax=Hahella ganghwensis TaxID=286420 RepID=UPI00037D00FF|nr:tetratricopeptide repeat protein [Hahella ganghwensis]